MLTRPISAKSAVQNLRGISRIVTLPDWQGVGLAFLLADTIGAAYKTLGYRLNNYPAHPSYIRANDRSRSWALVTRPNGMTARGSTKAGRQRLLRREQLGGWNAGSRPCAVFRYVGPAMAESDARALLGPYLR